MVQGVLWSGLSVRVTTLFRFTQCRLESLTPKSCMIRNDVLWGVPIVSYIVWFPKPIFILLQNSGSCLLVNYIWPRTSIWCKCRYHQRTAFSYRNIYSTNIRTEFFCTCVTISLCLFPQNSVYFMLYIYFFGVYEIFTVYIKDALKFTYSVPGPNG